MKLNLAVALALLLAAPVFAQSKPTAREVFNLRSRCAEAGNRIRSMGYRPEHGPVDYQHAIVVSNYNSQTNRCYVRLDYAQPNRSLNPTRTVNLYDGQTSELLAFAVWDNQGMWGVDPVGIVSNEVARKYIDKMMERDGEGARQ